MLTRPAIGDVTVYPAGTVSAARRRPCPEKPVTTIGSGVVVGTGVAVGAGVRTAATVAEGCVVGEDDVGRGDAEGSVAMPGALLVVATTGVLLSAMLLTKKPAMRMPSPMPTPSAAPPSVCMSERTSSLWRI